MSTLLQDLRFAVRVLLKAPGFSAAAVLVLAAAIGVNTAVFTFVNAFVLRPLPGREKPGEVVGLYSRDRTRPDAYRDFSYPTYIDIRQRATVFSDVTAFAVAFAGFRDGEATRRTLVFPVTSSYFSTLGVAVAAGRAFTLEEERPGAQAAVVVLSYDCWKRRGGSVADLGRTVEINGRPFTIVGVAPRGFTGTTAALAPEAWVPTGAWEAATAPGPGSPGLADRRNRALMVVGRLQPGVSQQAAAPALAALATALEHEFPGEHRDEELLAATLPRLTMSSRPQSDARSMGYSALVMLIASIVLAIAGMNLANMVLARGTARRKEIALRLALGAGRGRVVRQLLTEGFVLSLAGGAGGLVVAYWATRVLWASFAARSPIALSFDPAPDARVLAVTLGFCVFSTVLFGLAPAWRLSRTEVVPELKAQSGQSAGAAKAGRWSGRNLLVAGQFSLSLALLLTAGLFVRGAWNASTSEPGYRFDDRAVATLDAGLAGYDEARARAAYARIVERVRALPEVASASISSSVAFGTIVESRQVRVAGAPPEGAVDSVLTSVGSRYFQTLGLSMLRGRDFSEGEERGAGSPLVAIVDAPLARRLFGDENPVGRQVVMEEQDASPLLIVGVAPGLRQSLWDKAPVAHLYLPSGQAYRAVAYLHVNFRPGTPAGGGLQALAREIREADDRVPVMSVRTMAEHRAATTPYWAVGAMARIFSTFGGLAVFLAAVGVYAVKAYLVARRTREIGIRMALGSTPGQVLRLVLREGLGLTIAGLALGLLMGAGIGRAVSALLYDVSAFDPLVFTTAPAALVLAIVAACYLPARRATRIAPIAALRAE